MNSVLYASGGSTEWETPPELFKRYDDEYHFDIDVAANPRNKKCPRYFTEEENGLIQPWKGTCWLNPPYGRGIEPWIRKAYESAQAGATVVALLPARTDTRWFHEYVYGKARIEFLRGRVHFRLGERSGPANFPSMVVIWRGVGQPVKCLYCKKCKEDDDGRFYCPVKDCIVDAYLSEPCSGFEDNSLE
jgi:phage N-6-adenine-methyltransferase